MDEKQSMNPNDGGLIVALATMLEVDGNGGRLWSSKYDRWLVSKYNRWLGQTVTDARSR